MSEDDQAAASGWPAVEEPPAVLAPGASGGDAPGAAVAGAGMRAPVPTGALDQIGFGWRPEPGEAPDIDGATVPIQREQAPDGGARYRTPPALGPGQPEPAGTTTGPAPVAWFPAAGAGPELGYGGAGHAPAGYGGAGHAGYGGYLGGFPAASYDTQGGWPPPGGQPPWWAAPAGDWAPPEAPRRRSRLTTVLVALSLVIGVAVGAAGAIAWRGASRTLAFGSRSGGTAVPTPMAPPSDVSPVPGSTASTPAAGAPTGPVDLRAVAAKVDPAVVDVDTVLGYDQGRAAGTGIVLSSAGLVLTNNHVVSGATSVSVTDVGNGRSYAASVVGYDRSQDVAVLRLTGASGLPTAAIGDSTAVVVGDQIAAIGNAGGAGGTPSVVGGAVTGLNQSITATDASTGSAEQLAGLIQVDADVRAGDSGGPLVNASGQVLGIDTAASTGNDNSGAGGGQGYAIPIATAMSIGNQIIAGEGSTTIHIGSSAFLGVEVGTARGGDTSGAVVAGVVAGSPAGRLGLVAGDVIVALGAASVDSPGTLTDLMSRYHPGDTVRLSWQDNYGQHSGWVRLATGPVG